MIPEAYLKIGKAALPYIIGALIGALIVGWAQQIRVKHAKADLAAAKMNLTETKQELGTCQTANETNQSAIASLRGELQDALSGCDSRLAVKDRTLASLKRIRELTPGGPSSGKGVGNDKEHSGSSGNMLSSGDAILVDLNGMYRIPGVRPAPDCQD